MHNIQLTFRLLRKSPGFTLLAVLCLTLGIGVNTSIFSLLNSLYLRPLPVTEAERVVVLSRGGNPLISYAEYRELRDRTRSFDGLAVSEPEESDISFEGNAALIGAEPVSANYGAVLGASTLLGRWIDREDEPAAVISYDTWQRLFHGDRNVLGKIVRSESHTYTIVGVTRPEFGGIYAPLRIDLWVPFRFWAGENADRMRVMVFGRLKPGVIATQAAAELNAAAQRIHRENPSLAKGADAPLTVELVRGVPNPNSRRQAMPVVILLMTVVSLVLLIACVNVGNLVLARAAGRRHEIAVRLALGAGRARLLRQLMTENLVLGILGGAAGIMCGYWTNRLLEASIPALPFGEMLRIELPVDFRVLLFSAMVAVLTTLLFGLAPAWRSSRNDPASIMKGAGAAGGTRLRLRSAALAAQIALSLVLLLTAGLFLRTILRLQNIDPGFSGSRRLYAPVFLPRPEFTAESGRIFYDRTLARLRALHGVQSAALTTRLPLYAAGIETNCVSLPGGNPTPATTMSIGEGLLDTMQIPLAAGRDFNATDKPDNPAVAIVNQTLARRLWPDDPAPGKTLLFGCDHPVALQVIGVARDSKIRSLNEVTLPHVYLPFSQAYSGGIVFIVVATDGDPGPMMDIVRRMLNASSPDFRNYGVKLLSDSLDASYWQARWELWILGILGVLALLLAAVGLYGVMAYHVTSRTREIGIRLAIGARPADVFRLVIRQGLTVTLIGVAVGLVLIAAVSRLLASLLFGVSATDPITWLGASLVWLTTALLACWLPARRAAGVEPSVALRQD